MRLTGCAEMAGAIITVKAQKGFTMLPNSTLRDNRLSLKTRALLAIMVSLPEDWDYTVSGLASICDVGKDAVRTSLQELEDCGYLTRTQRHNENGHFSQNEYIVTDTPEAGGARLQGSGRAAQAPLSGYPSTDEPLTDNPTQQNKDCTNTPYSPPKGDGESTVSKKRASRRSAPKPAPDWKPERFAGFWEYYPRGESKQAAIRAWDRLQPSDELIDTMAHALRRQMESESWRAGVGIPYASTWLNNQRWTDAPKRPAAASAPPSGGWAPDPEAQSL